jgi:hypothetical protein
VVLSALRGGEHVGAPGRPELAPLITVEASGGRHFARFRTGTFATGPLASAVLHTIPEPSAYLLMAIGIPVPTPDAFIS